MPLGGRAEAALEQVVTAETHKIGLLDAVAPLQHLVHRRLEIVVDEALRHAAEMGKRQDMPQQKRFLALRGKCHHEDLARIAQPHDEKLHHHLLTLHDDGGLTPVDLGIDARVIGQR